MLSGNMYFVNISIAINTLWFIFRNNGSIANNSGNLKQAWVELAEMCILGGNSIAPLVYSGFEWCQVFFMIIFLNQINCTDGAIDVTNLFLVTDSIFIVQVHHVCWFGQHNEYDSPLAATFEKKKWMLYIFY